MLYSASIQAREASHVDPCFSVWVSGISLTGFRNYDQLSLAFNGQPVVLAGANGAGKTNLMEAISLLAPGRGLRRAKTARLKRQSPGRSAGRLEHFGARNPEGTAVSGRDRWRR